MIEYSDPTTGRTYTAGEDDPAALNEIISKLMARVADLEAENKTLDQNYRFAMAQAKDLGRQLNEERGKNHDVL